MCVGVYYDLSKKTHMHVPTIPSSQGYAPVWHLQEYKYMQAGMPKKALGWLHLGLGLEHEPFEFSCTVAFISCVW